MVRVAPLCVRGGWAALIVLLRRQVLAARSRRWRDRLRIIVQVTGVALGRRCCHPSTGGIVTVADIRAAGGRGRCKMPVAVRPVAAAGGEIDGNSVDMEKGHAFQATQP